MLLTAVQKNKLLDIAETTLECCIKKTKVPEFNIKDELLRQERGVFVTFHNDGRLWGHRQYIPGG